jgi:hypothetical protein
MANTNDLIVSKLGTRYKGVMIGDVSTFEGGIAGWTNASGVSLLQTATFAHGGTKSLKITSTVAGTVRAQHVSNALNGFPAAPGQTWFSQGYFRSDVAARTEQLMITWINNVGGIIGSQISAGIALSTTGWLQDTVTGVAPGGTVAVLIRTQYLTTAGAGEVFYADDILAYDVNNVTNKHFGDLWSEYCAETNGGVYWANDALYNHYGGTELTLADKANRFWTNWDPVVGG